MCDVVVLWQYTVLLGGCNCIKLTDAHAYWFISGSGQSVAAAAAAASACQTLLVLLCVLT
jgi:hypothetical protein